ncbi:MAG: nitroreductase family protein [Bacteroidales bacterium]|nr:nitroreductase family protein [Bacteroidales bacterium]MBN2749318.1 nitroreductase family protein [Bacteroidales bacterium]
MEQSSDKQTQITMRRSEMAFSLKELPTDTLFELFEAARWAASSYNEQPWRFYYAKREDPEAFVAVLNLLAEGNRVWAKDASVLIVSAAKKELHRTGRQNFYAMHDVGMATANLMIRATELGLATHPMGGFDHKLMHDTLMMDDTEYPVAVIAVGYKGNAAALPPELQKRLNAPRVRSNIESFTFDVNDL